MCYCALTKQFFELARGNWHSPSLMLTLLGDFAAEPVSLPLLGVPVRESLSQCHPVTQYPVLSGSAGTVSAAAEATGDRVKKSRPHLSLQTESPWKL